MDELIVKPIIIIGCNRSGTTLLFRNLSAHPDLWSLYIESQDIFYKHFPIDKIQGDYIDHRFLSDEVQRDISQSFYNQSNNKEIFQNHESLKLIPKKIFQRPITHFFKNKPIRLVEKTPANCFRIRFLKELFPDAKFIFLVRRGEDVISSLMEGWKNWSNSAKGGFRFNKWHYLVPPGAEEWKGKTLQEICAFQWIESNKTAWEDLNQYCKDDFIFYRHEDIMADPIRCYSELLHFAELPKSDYFMNVISNIRKNVYTTGGSKPKKDKWKRLHFDEIQSIRPKIKSVMDLFYEN